MHNIFKFIFTVFLLLAAKNIFAVDRYLTWVDPQTQLRVRINIETHELLTERNSTGWFKEGKIKLDSGIINTIPSRFKNGYFFLDNGKRIRFTVDGTGHVFDYFPLKRELIRVDRTIHSGYNFLSNKFIRNGIIYSAGGVGFWTYTSAITYFDEKLKEWEILRPKNQIPIPIVDGYQGYDSNLDVYYSGGSIVSDYLEDQQTKVIDDFFLFDFKKNKWEFLGKLNPGLPLSMPHKVIWTGNFFLHFYNNNIYIINPKTNKVHLYKSNTQSFVLGNLIHVNKDVITNFWSENGGMVQKISISEIRSKSVYWGEFYSSGVSNSWYYAAFSFLLIVGLFLRWRQSRSGKNKGLRLTEMERKLLLELLNLKEGEFMTTHDLNDIFETKNKSQENQRRIRFNIINELNTKLSLKFGHENGIDRKALPSDKRLIVYVLNPNIRSEVETYLNK